MIRFINDFASVCLHRMCKAVHTMGKEVFTMKKDDKHNHSCHKNQNNEKTAGKNQWTNNNLKYYPDERERQDGPGGN